MKKPSKKTLRNKMDKLCSEMVRARGRCDRCGKTQNLQCAHIISRSHLATRWSLDNLLCLCPDCHINFAHKNPLAFADWVRGKIGEEKYDLLKEVANHTTDYCVADYELKLKILKEMKELNEKHSSHSGHPHTV